MQDITELKREGFSTQAISELTALLTEASQVTPAALSLLTWRLEPSYRHLPRLFALRPQPVRQDHVAAVRSSGRILYDRVKTVWARAENKSHSWMPARSKDAPQSGGWR